MVCPSLVLSWAECITSLGQDQFPSHLGKEEIFLDFLHPRWKSVSHSSLLLCPIPVPIQADQTLGGQPFSG